MNIGTNAFHGENYCRDTSDSIIGNDSCYGRKACMGVDGIIIGYGSCWDTGCDEIILIMCCTRYTYYAYLHTYEPYIVLSSLILDSHLS
jgi:hypothetical protein